MRGFFHVRVPPDRYSLFVRQRGLYYASRSDGQGNVLPVEVKPGEVTYARVDVYPGRRF